MQVINVIEIEGGVIQAVHSHVSKSDKCTDIENIAEDLFIQKIKELEPGISDEDLQICLDNGIYTEENGQYCEVVYVQSDTVKIGKLKATKTKEV